MRCLILLLEQVDLLISIRTGEVFAAGSTAFANTENSMPHSLVFREAFGAGMTGYTTVRRSSLDKREFGTQVLGWCDNWSILEHDRNITLELMSRWCI